MKRFNKVLVGVDLSWGDRSVSEKLSAPNAEAVRQAVWLAKLNSASVDMGAGFGGPHRHGCIDDFLWAATMTAFAGWIVRREEYSIRQREREGRSGV